MTASRWDRIDRVWHAVLARPDADRALAIDELCAGDQELRHDVLSLFANLAQASAAGFGASNVIAAASAIAPGLRLGPYTVTARIGAGGMGEVYRGRDSRLGRDVAVKMLPRHLAVDPDRVRRFEQEAQAAAALNHPHIVAVHDIGVHEGSPYIVSELLEGQTLRQRLESTHGVRLPLRKAIEYARQIAHGLAAAHDKGIVHRDLKPENIFITDDGHAKILDFGLAKLTEFDGRLLSSRQSAASPHTVPGLAIGTPGYMAPEQVRGTATDHRADIFAFGAVLYELLTGRRAFPGETAIEIMTAVLSADPSPQPLAGSPTPPALVLVVQRCLEKDPAARFQSASDLAFALEALSGSHPAFSPAGGARSPRVFIARSLVAAAVVAIGAVGATIIALRYAVTPAPTPQELRLQIQTPPRAFELDFRIAPDGRRLVFTAPADGHSRLFLRSFSADMEVPLAGTENASYPFWSPDSAAVAFFADGKLKRVDLASGFVRTLADAPNPRRGAWHPDGAIVFSASAGSFYQVPSTGGPVRPVTALLPGQSNHRWPVFIPGTREFFLYAMGSPGVRGIYRGSLDSPTIRRVMEVDSAIELVPPHWALLERQGSLWAQRFTDGYQSPEGDLVPIAPHVLKDVDITALTAVSAASNGTIAYRPASSSRQLVWLDRTGTQIGIVAPPESTQLVLGALSADGRMGTVQRVVDGNTDAWLLGLDRGSFRRLTTSPAIDGPGSLSPDGKRLVFESDRNSGLYDLYEMATDGSPGDTLLAKSPMNKNSSDWSRDGRFIAYTEQHPQTDLDVWVLPRTAGGMRMPIAVSRFVEYDGRFSPDVHWIAFVSNESGRDEIYVQPFPGAGPKRKVSEGGGIEPRWRSDGRELFYLTPERRVASIAIDRSSTASFIATRPRTLFTLSDSALYDYQMTGDGQRFLVTMLAAPAPPITVLFNWRPPGK